MIKSSFFIRGQGMLLLAPLTLFMLLVSEPPLSGAQETPRCTPETAQNPPVSPTAGTWNELQRLLAGDRTVGAASGWSVDLDNDTAIMGARYDSGVGAAYVFVQDSYTGEWIEQAKLTASDGAADDFFGYAVAVDGDLAVVGAYGDDDNGSGSGSVYVFVRDSLSGTWSQDAKLTPSNAEAGDNFGNAVDIDNGTALIGMEGGDGPSGSEYGAAYAFIQDPVEGWTQQAMITASDSRPYQYFGHAVAIDGDVALIGAFWDDDNGIYAGAAYTFERDPGTGTWTQLDKLLASDGAVNDHFGSSVSLSNISNYALIGAHLDDNIGSAYVFERNGNVWTQVAKLLAPDGAMSDYFGFSVSIFYETALIGAYAHDGSGSNSGAAYVYEYDPGTGDWNHQATLTASDAEADDWFGHSVVLGYQKALIGTPWDDDSLATDCGSVYAFQYEGGEQTWFEEDDPAIIYTGTWTTLHCENCTEQALKYSGNAGNRIEFTFTGRGIKWYVAKARMLGKAAIFLDYTPIALVDLYSPTPQYQVVLQHMWALSEQRTVTIWVSGRKNPDATGYNVDLDAFEVIP